jgi:type IV secretory pathway VirB10-like protein
MKPLSESLEALAGRVKVLEDSATATFEADRARLEQRRHEIDEAFKTEGSEFESAVREAAQDGRTWWNDTKASMKRPLDEVRARVDKRQSEHELHRALRTADAAEEDAAAAIEVAAYFLNVAEYAVIEAALARMAADDLVAAVSASTAGATS